MKKGFTIAEIMVTLLVIAVVMAASAPIITKRTSRTAGGGMNNPWEWIGSTASAKFNSTGANATALIGAGTLPTGSPLPRLLISTDNNTRNHIEFSENGQPRGGIKLNNNGIFIGTYNNDSTANKLIAIGYDTNPSGTNSIAIGTNASVSGRDSIAIGHNAHVSGNASILFGSGCELIHDRCLALIPPTSNSGEGAKANTSITIPNSVNVVPIGGGNVTPQQLPANNAVLIGIGAQTVITDNVYIPEMLYAGNISANRIATNEIYFVNATTINATNITANTLTADYVNITTNEIYVNGQQLIAVPQQPQEKSDIRLKNIMGENKNGLDKIKQLKVYNYTFKNKPSEKRVGIVAQHLMKVFPDAVSKDENGYYVIRQEDMFYALVNAVKELDIKVKSLVETVSNIDKNYYSLENDLKKLSKQVETNASRINMLETKVLTLENKKLQGKN